MADRRMLAALVSGAAIVGLSAGLFFWSQMRGDADVFAACAQGQVAGGMGAIGGDFTLVSDAGETLSSAEALARPSLVYFGYTFCPDVCPLDTVRNADAADLLAEDGHDVQPVFVTVDPARDTPEVMAEFTDAIGGDTLGLTGSAEQVKAAADAYRVYFRVPDSDEEYYLVDHTTFTYLVLPGHGTVTYFRRETPAEEMAERVECFLNAA
ncbi:SCO family protein [Roseivivax isoporae]|uniref:Protein senC n=1 Tax=Roseivivax isoporae LMG 25204 TaxID=1449351 RepID=X7F734_9RHOB|nr:SCO family protein [Roseivivax isoporae]ETX27916.1 protein senC [Roseivivax isoporae LMG 25204]